MGAIRVHSSFTQRFLWVHLRPNAIFLPSVAVSKNDERCAALDGDVHMFLVLQKVAGHCLESNVESFNFVTKFF